MNLKWIICNLIYKMYKDYNRKYWFSLILRLIHKEVFRVPIVFCLLFVYNVGVQL